MAIVVEDGTGLANADSYSSVADADTYLASIGDPGSWSTQTVTAKEQALVRATQWLDNTYRTEWKGRRKLQTQALAWPRVEVYDEDDFLVPDDEVPTILAKATAEAAYRFLTAELSPDLDNGGALVKRTRAKVASLEEELEYVVGAVIGTEQFQKIEDMLAGLVDGSGSGSTDRG